MEIPLEARDPMIAMHVTLAERRNKPLDRNQGTMARRQIMLRM
jgi:hypothetical protein